jgi:uncharacterized protein (TIGR02145 family)
MNKFRQCLHAIGTQATDPFDKSAYLDLNTEYNQTVVNKKDSKTTTFLKEVAGTVRNALGSTDSDNVGELGNKITTGLQNQLENQAISTTESIINDKANQFVNQFGAGRSEISIHGLSSKELDYSIKTIQPISELNHNSKDLTFLQAQLSSGDNQGNRRKTINLGIGHRILVENDRAIAGINLFHDYETKSAHERLSLGLEYQRTNFGASVNVYHPLSDKKIIIADTTTTEEALAGYDIKFTGQAPYLPWATIKGSHYFWNAKASDNIKGNILGIEVKLTPSISFEFGQEDQQDTNNTNSKIYGKLNLKLPFDDNQPLTHFVIADKPFKASSKMNLGALDWVERSNKIRIEKDGVVTMNAFTYKTVTIGTQTWTAENMRHTIAGGGTFSNNILTDTDVLSYDNDVNNDANGYGKLYSWAAAMNGSVTEGSQGICATGWHIPSGDDWKILEDALGMSKADQDNTGRLRGTNQGTKLKVGGSSGFEGILAGFKNLSSSHIFEARGSDVKFWSSTSVIPAGVPASFNGQKALIRSLSSGNAQVGRRDYEKASYSLSVRCLKN